MGFTVSGVRVGGFRAKGSQALDGRKQQRDYKLHHDAGIPSLGAHNVEQPRGRLMSAQLLWNAILATEGFTTLEPNELNTKV